jgi:hypothetical protein
MKRPIRRKSAPNPKTTREPPKTHAGRKPQRVERLGTEGRSTGQIPLFSPMGSRQGLTSVVRKCLR